MASGLVCRANRPNTWLHRPACKREEKPCQLGAVHTWHDAVVSRCPLLRRLWGLSGSRSASSIYELHALKKSGLAHLDSNAASLACALRRLACRCWAGRVALRENRARQIVQQVRKEVKRPGPKIISRNQ